MNYNFFSATILLILITDPFGNIPIFANALKNVPQKRRSLSDGFLRAMNLSPPSLQIAGGVIFFDALRIIFRRQSRRGFKTFQTQ